MITYIYILIDPITSEVRYVGKSINPKRRLQDHLIIKKKTHCSFWVQSLLKQNCKPDILVIDSTENNWQELESYWISQFKTWNFNLTNHTDGGEGLPGFKKSKETLKKMSEAKIGKRYALGCKRSVEFKNNLAERFKNNSINKGIIRDQKFKNKVSKNNARSHSIVNEEEVILICKLINLGYNLRKIKLQIPQLTTPALYGIKHHKTWTHITSKYLT